MNGCTAAARSGILVALEMVYATIFSSTHVSPREKKENLFHV